MKALKLSSQAGIFEMTDNKGNSTLVYQNCYEHRFDLCNTRQAKTRDIMKEFNDFYNYFERKK